MYTKTCKLANEKNELGSLLDKQVEGPPKNFVDRAQALDS